MYLIKRPIITSAIAIFCFSLLGVKIFDISYAVIQGSTYKPIEQDQLSLVLREFSPNLNVYVKPADNEMLWTDSLVQKDYLLRTDEEGFVIGPEDINRSGEKVELLFLGGSTTLCLFVDEDKRFPNLVSKNLGVRVINGGFGGSNSMHSLLRLVGRGIPQKPNYVILMHAINDLTHISKTLSYWNGPNSRSLIIGKIETNEKDLAYKSVLLNALREIKNFLFPNIWIKIRPLFQGFVESVQDEWLEYRGQTLDYKDIDRALEEQFTASLKSFIRVSRSWDIEPILMTQFNRIKNNDDFIKTGYGKNPQPISYDNFVNLYAKANEIVRKVAKEEKVFLIDLDLQIPSTNQYIYDSVHLNQQGSELVAEKITMALRERHPLKYR